MKIISKYKDYYDGTQAMGFDESLVYVRHQIVKSVTMPSSYKSYRQNSDDTIELDRFNLETGDYGHNNQEHIDINELEIGFCGKLYPALQFRHIKEENVIGKKVLYNSADIMKYIGQLEHKFKKIFYRSTFYNYYLEKPTIKSLDEYFFQKKYEYNYIDWFQDFETPIFIFTTDPERDRTNYQNKLNQNIRFIISNPKLKDLEFYRIKDNFSAYQEISQFIGGVLSNTEIGESTLSDKEKVLQHGFDLKYGFRTRPKKRKK